MANMKKFSKSKYPEMHVIRICIYIFSENPLHFLVSKYGDLNRRFRCLPFRKHFALWPNISSLCSIAKFPVHFTSPSSELLKISEGKVERRGLITCWDDQIASYQELNYYQRIFAYDLHEMIDKNRWVGYSFLFLKWKALTISKDIQFAANCGGWKLSRKGE